MAIPSDLADFHREQAEIAKQLYVKSLSDSDPVAIWREHFAAAQQTISNTLRETDWLRNVPAALEKSVGHMFVLRRLMAPPISQDQFKLLCRSYSKEREKKSAPCGSAEAKEMALHFSQRRNRRLTPWLDKNAAPPSRRELRVFLEAASTLIAMQSAGTSRRTLMASKQESEVIALLLKMKWSRKPSRLITQRSSVAAMEFMHKSRFETQTKSKEVDIACGLGGTIVLAMECKVTNDETNSVKRVDDVLNKAHAWQQHWASFVRTAALLQGVVKYSDVERLLTANVQVFWSHRLSDFREWLANEVEVSARRK